MTEAEIYEFDLNGIIIYPGLIPPENVARMNKLIDADQQDTFPHSFQYLDLDSIFMDLMANPRTLEIIRVMCGEWLRIDHTYGLQMTKDYDVKENLHGGLRADQGEHQYQWCYNQMHNGLIVVMYALEDVNPEDGGFICVPGSHKANPAFKPSVSSHLVHNPSLKAGDMLIFTEALVHGTRRWQSDQRRRSLLYKYSPGYSTWGNPEHMEHYADIATTQLQKDLLRPPYVGKRKPLEFPEV